MGNPKTLQSAILFFSDEQRCIDAVAAMRWMGGVVCPHCGSKRISCYLKAQKRWKCAECRQQFSVKVGTIFEDSPISLTKWLPALWLLCNCKNGVSSWEIHRALGVTQKTAWFMLHRIRLGIQAPQSKHKMGGGNGGAVEVDESFIGGKARNMHKSRRLKYQQARSMYTRATLVTGPPAVRYLGKTPVMGILDREQRKVRASIIPAVKRETLQAEILRQVEKGSTVYTDQAVAYEQALSKDYVHETVNHLNRYVDGRIHTNGLENFWSLLKRGLEGTYIAVEPFHLFRYLDEAMFRYNNRATKDNPLNDSDRFLFALSQIAGKRLTYNELTGKAPDGTTDAEPF